MKINTKQSGSLKNYIEKFKIWVDWKNYYHLQNLEYPIDFCENGIPAYPAWQVPNINSDPSKIIVIDNIPEGINFQKTFNKYSTDKFYIIFSGGRWDPNTYHLPFNYINIQHYFYFYEFANFLFSPLRFQFYFENTYDFTYPKKCLFAGTVGTVRKERDFFINLLTSKLDTKNFILRYSYKEIGIPGGEYDVHKGTLGKFDGYDTIAGLEKYYHSLSVTIPINLYNQGYFNLLFEGDIDWKDQFVPTEKIAKTLVTGMPFVLVGSPLFLKNIKEMGFRTYNTLWDESYDDIVDYSERADKIIKLCNDLLNFDWNKHQQELIEIAKHNRECFLKLNLIATKEFLTATEQINQVKKHLNI